MNWKTKTMLIGGFAGLLIGILAALFYIRTVQGEQGDKEEIKPPPVKTTDILHILVTAVGLVRTVAGLGTREEGL